MDNDQMRVLMTPVEFNMNLPFDRRRHLENQSTRAAN
jgi:hypothetical protein